MRDSTIAKLLFYLFKILGLVPVTYDAKDLFIRSRRSILYSVIVMSCVLAMSCYAVKLSLKDNPAVQFDRTIDSVHTIIGASTSLIVIGMYCVRRDKAVDIVNRLKILRELPMFNGKGILTRTVKKTCIYVFFTWVPLLFTVPVKPYQAFLYVSATYCCAAIIYSAMLQYSLFLNFVGRLFAIVNDNFTSMQRIHFVGIENQLTSARFSRLRELHVMLSEVCERLDEFYSQPILLCIFYVFSTLILSEYYVLKSLLFNKFGLSTMFVLHCFAQLAHGFTVMLVLTRSAAGVVKESKRTGKIVNELMEIDNKIIAKINQFSNYLVHQNVQFSAFGLFLIDGTLLMSIIGSITTYIVILLQFQDRDSIQRQPESK